MSLRTPSRRVQKNTGGIAQILIKPKAGLVKTQLFALMLLPRALTLSLNHTPMDRFISTANANDVATVKTNLVFDTTQPLALRFTSDAPTIQKGTSRAEEEVAQKKAAAKTQSTKTSVSTQSTTTTQSVAAPDLETKRALVQKIAASHNIDWKLLEAVWQIESGKAWKTGVQSYVGATGPMQFMPGTWKHYGTGDITYAPDALNAGASLLAANGAANGNIDSALFSYNHAQWYVDKVKTIMNSI